MSKKNKTSKAVKKDSGLSPFMHLIIIGFSPMIIRAYFFIDATDNDYSLFDTKDFLFLGMALNLSNVSLSGHLEYKSIKDKSLYLIVGIAILLGCQFYCESNGDSISTTAILAALITTIASLYFSYQMNGEIAKRLSPIES